MTRFTHRYVNQVAGVFVLLTLLISGIGIYMAGRAQHWFESTIAIELLLPEEGCCGLKPGAAVIVMGTEVGEITQIRVRDDDRMTARTVVREGFSRFIGTESRATIKKTLGMAGDAYVEFTGRRGLPLSEDALVDTTVDRSINEMLEETLDQIRTEVLPAVRAIRLAADSNAQLMAGLDDPGHPALEVLETLNSIATKIDQGDGLANRILADRGMADDVRGMIARINLTLDEADAAVGEFQKFAAQLGRSAQELHKAVEQTPETVRLVNATLEDVHRISGDLARATALMPDTLENFNHQVSLLSGPIIQAQSTLREFQRLAEAGQRHWLVRGYVEYDEANVRIAPREVIVTP